MANQEHVDLLKQGIDTWHKWRQEHQGIQPDLSGANLSEANLSGANLNEADFSKANLSDGCLNSTILVRTNLEGANLTGCNIYGVSAWNIKLRDAIQSNLIITDLDEPTITVDNLKVAQFIYLLLN